MPPPPNSRSNNSSRSTSSRRPPARKGKPVRLQRIIADAGVAARRAAERLIEEGRVQVNGQTIATLPAFVDPLNDRILVDGRPLPKPEGTKGGKPGRVRHVYIMLNKPARVLSTAADEPGLDRTTIMDLVKHPTAPRLFPVGRLGYETEGLVLLTNDGEMANRLTHPRYGIPRTYRAVVKGVLEDVDIAKLQRELGRLVMRQARQRMRETGRGAPVRPAPPSQAPTSSFVAPSTPAPSTPAVELELEKRESDRTTLYATAREGRTGDLGELFAAAGVRIRKLERIAIGPLELAGVARGRWRELDRGEVQALRSAARGQATARPAARSRQRPASTSASSARASRGPKDKPAQRATRSTRPAPRASKPLPRPERPASSADGLILRGGSPTTDRDQRDQRQKPVKSGPKQRPAPAPRAGGKPASRTGTNTLRGGKPASSSGKPAYGSVKPAYGKPARSKPARSQPARGKPARAPRSPRP